MQALVIFTVFLYITFYALEGPIRYVLNLIGLDEGIFLRDAVMMFTLVAVGTAGLLRKSLHPAFLVFMALLILHGLITFFNLGLLAPIAYGAKVFMTMLFGAIAAPILCNPTPVQLRFYAGIWGITVLGVVLHKFDLISIPWSGLTTTIGGVDVEINRDWDTNGIEKRASGFTRSSIHAANLLPPLALLTALHFKSQIAKLAIPLVTIATLLFTTQKGSLIAYTLVALMLVLHTLQPKIGSFAMRGWFFIALLMAVLFPVMLPGYLMPHAEGQFSLASFNLRVEEMWPQAWAWINAHDAFPFGVGLGGIGGAMRFIPGATENAADNMFVFLYAHFGMLSLVYLGIVTFCVLRLRRDMTPDQQQAQATLTYIITYGIVLSLIEDQMACLFIGASLATLLRIPNVMADKTSDSLPYREVSRDPA